MKIFSIKRLLGAAALYGASQYARKHGGPRNAVQELIGKVREAANARRDQTISPAHAQRIDPSADIVGSSRGFADESASGPNRGIYGAGGDGPTRRG